MNYILRNLKLIQVALALSSAPTIYFAMKPRAMNECRAQFAKESKVKEDEMASKIIVGDGQRF